ncbi:NADP-binding protein [Dacryopinax primogenitus]|uniref:NADP-binding protein n=1 Tax=Dacryopinax primogenitus (strain DJM 731) TaxID=1858805 RepID=M5G685_DACPD|nr:NADP-binding protein [Dacryopinax primogenitus]EJU05771.1 NADP-binding protein [Dacryopinax primogenitus]
MVSPNPRVIVLTGGNKGIGYAIAQALLRSSEPILLYLTARDPALGQEAVDKLRSNLSAGSDVCFHQEIGAMDVLINNAGILPVRELTADLAREVVQCNYDGTKSVTLALLPLIKPRGRVVNVSSTGGAMRNLPSTTLRARFLDPALTLDKLDSLMRKFESDVQEGRWKEEGWTDNAYRVSKMGMTGLSMVLARETPGVLINACCPGWVKTDMAPLGTKTPEEGARTPVFLAIGTIGGKTGRFWRDEIEVPWTEGPE